MVKVNSETVYTVELESTDLTQLERGDNLTFELPSGNSITLRSEGRVEPEDVSPEEIEEMIKEAPEKAPEVEGSPVAEEDQAGNGATGGMIDIDRGG